MELQQRGRYSNVMSFKYYDGPVVTILVSKTAGRYRIQSDSLHAMWLIVQVMPCFALACFAYVCRTANNNELL